MKILITTDWYQPVINGVVTSVVNLKEALEEHGHEVMVLTLSSSSRSYRKGNVIYIGSQNVSRIYPDARLRISLPHEWVRRVAEWGPDIVHSQCELSTFRFARKIAKMLNIPIVHTYHTVYEDYTHYFSPGKRVGKTAARVMTRSICKRVDQVIAPTQKTAHLLSNYEIQTPVSVIPSGIVLRKYDAAGSDSPVSRSKWNISENTPVLLYLGRLAAEKNLHEILRYFQSYDGPSLIFMIVGDGPERRAVEEAAESVSDKVRVIFTGMVSPGEVPEYYRLADLFVSASQSETQGLTYIEAAASGLPLLCRKDECLDEVIDGNGWQYSTQSEFERYLSEFLSCDADGIAGKCEQSILQANRFDIQTVVLQILLLYQQTIDHFMMMKNAPGGMPHGKQ